MPVSLPARANLEFIKKQSKDLQRAFAAGDPDALQRIHAHLPRARQLGDDELRALDLSLQESQHALACEYGFGKWEDLLVAVEPPSFEDLIRLPHRATRALVRELEQRDVVHALVGASDEVRDWLLMRMSERVRGFVRTEIVYASDSGAERVAEARERFVAKVLELRERGVLTWPPSGDIPAPAPSRENPGPDRLGRELMDLTPDDLLEALVGAAEQARREGILFLQRHIDGSSGTLLTEAVQLAVDGTHPDLVQDLLETRAATILRLRTIGAYMAIEGWLAIQAGDNPTIVQQKMESIYIEAPEPPTYPDSIPSAEELVQRLRSAGRTYVTPSEMIPFFVDLATLRRLDGLPAVLALADAIGDPVLAAGIRATAAKGSEPRAIIEAMKECAQRERLELRRRHWMVIAGVVSIQSGDNPRIVEQRIQEAGDEGVAELAAEGFPGYA